MAKSPTVAITRVTETVQKKGKDIRNKNNSSDDDKGNYKHTAWIIIKTRDCLSETEQF